MNFLFVCLAAHESEASSMDSCKRQTATATPAEPGELPSVLARLISILRSRCFRFTGSRAYDICSAAGLGRGSRVTAVRRRRSVQASPADGRCKRSSAGRSWRTPARCRWCARGGSPGAVSFEHYTATGAASVRLAMIPHHARTARSRKRFVMNPNFSDVYLKAGMKNSVKHSGRRSRIGLSDGRSGRI